MRDLGWVAHFLFFNHHFQKKEIPEQIALSCLPVLSMDEIIL